MLKGVTRIDDAKRAVDAGVSAISVSNHGGNNLDGTPATIRALRPVAEAVGDQIEVLLDGGIRRGSDVVKAVALGAKAVMIGRASLWGLAAGGQAGVENVLDLLRSGIESALLGLGHASIGELSPDDLVIPDGFVRRLGADPPTAGRRSDGSSRGRRAVRRRTSPRRGRWFRPPGPRSACWTSSREYSRVTISSIFSCPASTRLSRVGTWTRGSGIRTRCPSASG